MTLPQQVVQVTYVDIITKTTVYSGLTTTLYNDWTSIRIHIDGDNTFSSASVTISDHDNSTKNNLKITGIRNGETKIVKYGDEAGVGIKTYPFEVGKKYSIKIVADKTDGTSYVGRFTWGSHTNKKVFPFIFRDSTKLDNMGQLEIEDHELVEQGQNIKLSCPITTPSLTSLENQKATLQTNLNTLNSDLSTLNSELGQLTQGTPEYIAKQGEITAKQGEITAKQGEITAKQAEIDAEIGGYEEVYTISTPSFLKIAFEEIDNYSGLVNDTDNTEDTAAYVYVEYNTNGNYEIQSDKLAGLANDRVYNVAVTVHYTDGHTISKTLDDNLHMIVNPAITVDPYGLGDDNTGAGDLATSSVAVLYVEKETIGVSASRIPANDEFKVNFSQGTTIMYTGTLKVSEGAETTRDEKTVLMYDIKRNQLTKPGTPAANSDGTFAFDAQIIVDYPTLSGTSVSTLEKPSNAVSGTYVNDYTPLTNVYVANAWMAATKVDVSGNRVVDMTDATTASGYTNAPDYGIVGYFHKTAHFGNGETGLLQDLDVVGTKFKYEITDANGTWIPVTEIHQIQGGDAPTTAQQNYIAVNGTTNVKSGGGDNANEYANIPYPTVKSGPSQPPIYFRICEPTVIEGQNVKVRVTIVPEGNSTDVSSTESNVSNGNVPVVVVKRISRYKMTVEEDSEPIFTGSGYDGILAVPINAEESGADSTFVSARFESNLAAPNADITQTDNNADNVYDLIVTNPSKRGASDPVIYTVSYKINDPTTTTAGTVSIKSIPYTISVTDEPTSENFTVTDYDYKTFNDDGESSFTFKISFKNEATTSIKGVNVYFFNSDVSSERILVKDIPRGDVADNVSTEYTVTLQDSAGDADSSAASDGILIDLTGGTNSANKWLNYRSATISFVPYTTPRVSPRFLTYTPNFRHDNGKIENNAAKTEKFILNIPVIDMPKNVLLVGGVVESHKGTQLKWSDDRDDYPSSSAVGPSYDVEVNGVNKSVNVVADSADSSKRSYSVDTDSNSAPYNFTIVLQTKLASTVDSTVYYSKPVTVEFTSASVDLSNATAVVRRGSNVTTLKAHLNGYEVTDASETITPTPTGVTVFAAPNFEENSLSYSPYLLTPNVYDYYSLNSIGISDNINSIRIPRGFTVKAWYNNIGNAQNPDLLTPDATYTSDTAETIGSISSVIVSGSYTPTPSNLNVTEFKLVDASENVCIAMQNDVETVLTDAQINGVIGSSNRSIITHDADVDGWSIKNTYADGAAASPKVMLNYYGNAVAASVIPPTPNGDGLNASNSFTLSQATGLGLYAVFNQNQGAKEYPFFNAYTAKTTSGTNKSWYKSKVFYGSDSSGDTTTDSNKAGLTLVFTGTDDGLLFPEITRRVQYVVKVGPNLTNANESYESEPVWFLTLQTSSQITSSSEGYNFRLLETGVFVDGDKLNVRYNVGVSDPESAAVNELSCSSTNADIQAVGTIHTYDLSTDYVKSDTLQLLARMEAGVDYTEKRGNADAEASESEPTYLSLVPTAKVPYTCASKPSVEVVGTRGTSELDENRKVINLNINANGLKREGVQSVIISLLKEGDHTVDGASEGSEIVLSFESTNARLRSYLVEENGATVTTTGSSDNLGPLEHHELLENDVDGFSGTALSNTNTFLLVMGTLDDNDESKLHLPVGSEWDDGDVTVLAVVSTRIGTDIDYDAVVDMVEP